MRYEKYFDGDQAAENASYEENARYDYIAELRREHDDGFALEREYQEEIQGELDIRIHYEDGRMVTNAPRDIVRWGIDEDIPF